MKTLTLELSDVQVVKFKHAIKNKTALLDNDIRHLILDEVLAKSDISLLVTMSRDQAICLKEIMLFSTSLPSEEETVNAETRAKVTKALESLLGEENV